MAQRFDASRLEPAGEPIRVVEQVGSFASFGLFSVSTNGVLIYRVTNQNSQLTWFDRQGKFLGVVGEPGLYQSPISQSPVSLSPDGTRAAVSRRGDDGIDVWLFEFGRGVSTPLTFGPKVNSFPVWSDRGGHFDLYQRSSNGTGKDEQLLTSDRNKFPMSWSPDGRFLLYSELDFPQLDLWRDGRELFYLAPDGRVMAVEVTTNGLFQAGVPHPLFQGPPNAPIRAGYSTPSWDVTADGKQFLFLVPQLDNSRVPFTVLLNWRTRLKK